jgi:hypothetical protein
MIIVTPPLRALGKAVHLVMNACLSVVKIQFVNIAQFVSPNIYCLLLSYSWY